MASLAHIPTLVCTAVLGPDPAAAADLARLAFGALAAVLGGIDTLVFTGGIGEHAAPVRWEACAGLEHLGIKIDRARNARHDPVVSAPGSSCTVRVVRTDEDLMIARHTRALLGRASV